MAVAKKIAYNVFFNATAKIISTVLALVGIGFITRYLGTEGFGNYSTVIAFFSFFGAIADLGLYSIATREISRPNADEKKIMGNVFVLRLLSAVAIFMITPVIIFFLPYSHEVKIGIIIAAASFGFSSSYSVLNGIFQKNIAMDKVAIADIIGKTIQTAIIILAVKKDLGFSMIISSLLFYMVFNFIVVFLWSRKYLKFKLEFDFEYWKKFLKNSLPMGISVAITFVYFKIDTILLSFLKTSADVGIYNAAYKIIENITFFPGMMMGLIFPLISHDIFHDREKFKSVSNKTFKIFLILVIPLLIGTLFLADGIIGLIGGAQFMNASNTLRILIFALVFIFFSNFFNNVLIAGNFQKKLVWVLAGCAAFNITANLIFIPIFSYNGAAVVSVLTEFFVVASTFYLTYRYVNYLPKPENIGKIFLSGLAMAFFLFISDGENFFIRMLGSAAIYFFFLWITKAITNEEIQSIVSSRKQESTVEQPTIIE
jgi:O-antigen/teichoic acid export membrane protein